MPRVTRSPIAGWIDPAVAFAEFCGDDSNVVWLDSGPDALTGRSYIGRAERQLSSETSASVLDALRGDLERIRVEPAPHGFALGWVGWLGYETRFETMDVEPSPKAAHPQSALLFLGEAIEFDHATRAVTILSLGDPSDRALSLGRATPPSEPGSTVGDTAPPVPAVWRDTDGEYLAKIRESKARIAAGDAYLLCLTTEATVDVHPDPVETFLRLRRASPSHHGAFIRIGEVSLLSSSPELFLSISPSGVIESRPIKGTRPRGATPALDERLAAELRTSEKERAENVMIVDLMRNDIGRVSVVGSVEVPSLLAVESYSTVHQLVSTVRGQLAHGLDAIDVVKACFPAGSMTGTPKSSATRILEQLEGHRRGIYSGAFGYFGLDRRVDLAMVIRSIVLSPEGASIGTGGGITSLSDPDEELAEVKLKAAVLLEVLGAAER